MTPEETMIVERLRTTFANVEELEKEYAIIVNVALTQAKEIHGLKTLCTRAADALDIMTQMLLISDVPLEWEENKRRENKIIIAELRKAAE
jgi:hypothetical protein